MTILDEILRHTREEVARARRQDPFDPWPPPAGLPILRDFRGALVAPGAFRVIAEVKKASPSRGVIRADFDPVRIAETYARHGAAALSVLTDEKYFQGRIEFLARIRETVPLPILRKDFVIDPWQLRESRARGADAILLIAAALTPGDLRALHAEARRLGLDVLVEVHDEPELVAAVEAGAEIFGINNRDLRTFEVTLETTRRLAPKIPAGAVGVCESGIHTRNDLDEMVRCGIRCFLIGESLMSAPDPGARLAELIGGEGKAG
jgi:indole-3-glycerol phosphate synthase